MRYLHETLKLYAENKLSVKEHLNEVKALLKDDETTNSFITLDVEGAEAMSGDLPNGALKGAIVGIKDNINCKGLKMTCGSRLLKDFVSVYDADVTCHVKESGAIVMGKLNMDEFAMGSSNETSFFGAVKNPIDNRLVPGGSSGGSAAAVRKGFVDVSLGTDTGGSIRQPASFCDVVGIKPTYGAVSRFGVTSLANTFDTVGSFGRCVKDAYLLLQAIAKPSKNDMTKIDVKLPDLYATGDEATAALKGKRIAIFKNLEDFEMDDEVESAYRNSIRILQDAGAEVIEEEFKYLKYAVGCYYALIDAEASSNLSRFDGIRFAGVDYDGNDIQEYMTKVRSLGFNDEVKRRILIGMHILSSAKRDELYKKALRVRRAIADDYRRIFNGCDAILTPTVTTLPFELGTKVKNPRNMMEGDLLTVAVNIAGLPAISVPTTGDIKINAGMQFIGSHGSDADIAKICMGFEGLVK